MAYSVGIHNSLACLLIMNICRLEACGMQSSKFPSNSQHLRLFRETMQEVCMELSHGQKVSLCCVLLNEPFYVCFILSSEQQSL